jgi:hypothetical protein
MNKPANKIKSTVTRQIEVLDITIADLRKTLADKIASGSNVLTYSTTLVELTEAEGRRNVWKAVQKWIDNGCGSEAIRSQLTSILCVGMDDDSSGRTNDLRRASFDGVRKAVSMAFTAIGID